ncbi:Fe-only nitrogenase accessory AnfO family protein, partial [Rubrivivax gelatinosus]
MKIVVHLDDAGVPASLYRAGTLCVYDDEGGAPWGWRAGASHRWDPGPAPTLQTLKAALAEAVAALGDGGGVLLSAEVRGLPYALLLEQHRWRVWMSEGPLEEQLEDVRRRETEAQAKKRYELVLLGEQPVPTPLQRAGGEPGHFWIDLRAALEHPSNPTSRHVLIPFLQAGRFVRLEVLCGHLPKWMAWEIERLDLAAESAPLDDAGDGLRVTIHSRQGPEGRRRPPGLAGNAAALALPC